ncbi:MAG: FAD-dependent monooxygenase [Alphaproteobacteria bacterium]|nr:FAD-dependent monooxygenase [Alphaproteobacteria bacterium]
MVTPIKADVTIIGGGLAGGVLALALCQKGVRTVVIDRDPPMTQIDPNLDGRTTSVGYGSQQIFEKIGIWDAMAPYAEPIWDIRVFEGGSPWTVDYNHADIGPNPMGYIVENSAIRLAIQEKVNQEISSQGRSNQENAGDSCLTWIAPAPIKSAKRLSGHVIVETGCGQIIESALLVGADGRSSATRAESSITAKTWDYKQTALVIHITHEKPHDGTAWEVFLPEGPLAVLPMNPCPKTGNARSGIVWAKTKGYDWYKDSDDQLSADLQKQFPFYGDIKISSRRWTYPLSALTVDSIVDHRLALVGDSAHGVHPIAGQGVNLGWRDADTLADIVSNAKSIGLDLGSATILAHYKQARKQDHRLGLWSTDGINRLFSNNSRVLHFVRNAGFAAVNNCPPLKKYFMRKAMGIS